jgi:CheY-like chemotaxis protein
MARPGRILVLEDLPRWQGILREALESGGFRVEVAASQKEAFERLRTQPFHLMILDLRLDDADVENWEGMDLLRELSRHGINESFRTIVLTAYPTHDTMREAFARRGVYDFCAKQDFDQEEFLAEIQEMFRTFGVNLDLEVHWQGGIDAEQAVLNLRVGGDRVKKGTARQELLAQELDDLLCRLFSKAESLLVNPLPTGRSGSGVLLAQPFFPEGGGARNVVVKFGDVDDLSREYQRFVEYVGPYVGRSSEVKARARTQRLGGVQYSLVGDTRGRLDSFEGFYRGASLPAIRSALDRLFLDTCGAWYENPGKLRPLDLTAHYFTGLGMTEKNLRHGLEALKSVQGSDRLYFQGLSDADRRPLPNPMTVFPAKPTVVTSYETITHGDLNPQNVLLDEDGSSWLIDFQRTGPGHILRDLVELDVAIRILLLTPEEASLDDRLALEEALSRSSSVSGLEDAVPELPNAAVAKACATSIHLRGLATRILSRYTSVDLTEYQAGALFCGLNLTRFLVYPTVQREHALLSACLLTERFAR